MTAAPVVGAAILVATAVHVGRGACAAAVVHDCVVDLVGIAADVYVGVASTATTSVRGGAAHFAGVAAHANGAAQAAAASHVSVAIQAVADVGAGRMLETRFRCVCLIQDMSIAAIKTGGRRHA